MPTSGFEITSDFQEIRGFPSISEVFIEIQCLVKFTYKNHMHLGFENNHCMSSGKLFLYIRYLKQLVYNYLNISLDAFD